MATERKRKEFQLMQIDIDYINEIAEKYKIGTGDTLSKILREHKENNLNKSKHIEEKLLQSINNLNKLSEIQLEITNSICMKENYQEKDFVSRKDFTSELIAKAYKTVEEKISNSNIKKFSK